MQTQVLRAERQARGLSAGLGWFSLGLGLTQVLAPGAVTRLIGARDNERRRTIMRVLGLREITAGLGILMQGQPHWLWTRVFGDVIDLALLGTTARKSSTRTARALTAGAGVLGVTLLDTGEAVRRTRASRARSKTHELRAFITIGCSADEVYRFWRNLENLPRFMSHLEAVRAQNGFSRWWAKAPGGKELKWDAEITVDRPDELIAWQSLRGAELTNRGSVRFKPAPGGRGTEVHLKLEFEPPGGRLAEPLAKLVAKITEQTLRNDLRRLKQLLELGEVVRSDASIHSGLHAARPEPTPSLPGEAGVR